MADKSIREEMKERCRLCTAVFCISFIVALALIIGGFFVPHMGIIDGSVLTAVGELIIFPALAFGMRAVTLGYDLRLQKGDASMEITNDKDKSHEA